MQRIFSLLIILSALGLEMLAQEGALIGHAVNARTNHGIENLTVVLIAPTASSLPKRIATTDQNGEFSFGQVPAGQYVLKVSEGPHFLYRKAIKLPRDSSIQILLQPGP